MELHGRALIGATMIAEIRKDAMMSGGQKSGAKSRLPSKMNVGPNQNDVMSSGAKKVIPEDKGHGAIALIVGIKG